MNNFPLRHLFFFTGFLLLSCSDDDSSENEFLCCTEELDGNVNNLAGNPDLAALDDIEVFNFFTPNNDGVNDRFFIGNIENYPNHSVEIFRLNGQSVFETNNYGFGGGDLFEGEGLSQGSYRYRIVIQNEDTFLLQGYLCLIRELQEDFPFGPECPISNIPDPIIGLQL